MAMNWFISGVSSGFGRLIAELALERGDRVFGTARRGGALAEVQQRHAGALVVAPMELTDLLSIRHTVDDAFTRLGRIDVVVSNAAYGLVGAGEELTSEQIRHQVDTNLVGSIELIRAVLPHLRRQGGGRVIQVSSEGGQIAYPNFSLYHATKWGIEGFIESVAQEVAPFRIQFTIAEPGPAATGFRDATVRAEPMDVYRDTPAGAVRRAIEENTFVLTGDPVKFARAILQSASQDPAPRRLALGSTAYANIRTALQQRLHELEVNKPITVAADVS